eukprot:gnl/Chilomastix_cuspidata/2139.p1 GENE.gnl/Chilomastix_cuspidata/2139~~gnl/Chilomastix_cuspidata/2139.p1  ORF type:complete len:500 (-),score=77.42 gnl/Chilomastix_cuspidata/2139:42-1478(-)
MRFALLLFCALLTTVANGAAAIHQISIYSNGQAQFYENITLNRVEDSSLFEGGILVADPVQDTLYFDRHSLEKNMNSGLESYHIRPRALGNVGWDTGLVGREVVVRSPDGDTSGTLLQLRGDQVVLRLASGATVLLCGFSSIRAAPMQDTEAPATLVVVARGAPNLPRSLPLGVWYFAGGLSWRIDHQLFIDRHAAPGTLRRRAHLVSTAAVESAMAADLFVGKLSLVLGGSSSPQPTRFAALAASADAAMANAMYEGAAATVAGETHVFALEGVTLAANRTTFVPLSERVLDGVTLRYSFRCVFGPSTPPQPAALAYVVTNRDIGGGGSTIPQGRVSLFLADIGGGAVLKRRAGLPSVPPLGVREFEGEPSLSVVCSCTASADSSNSAVRDIVEIVCVAPHDVARAFADEDSLEVRYARRPGKLKALRVKHGPSPVDKHGTELAWNIHPAHERLVECGDESVELFRVRFKADTELRR